MEYGSMAQRLHLHAKKMRFKDPGTLSTLLIGNEEDGIEEEDEMQVVEVMPSRHQPVESDEDDYVMTVNMFGDEGMVVHDDDSQDSLDYRSDYDDDEHAESNIDSNIDGFLQDYLEQNRNRLKVISLVLMVGSLPDADIGCPECMLLHC